WSARGKTTALPGGSAVGRRTWRTGSNRGAARAGATASSRCSGSSSWSRSPRPRCWRPRPGRTLWLAPTRRPRRRTRGRSCPGRCPSAPPRGSRDGRFVSPPDGSRADHAVAGPALRTVRRRSSG
ncbi:MAG: hypothetical protein AVDCRST_MAG49-2241, partial [uncultured Thermomicrobiales bacterium]